MKAEFDGTVETGSGPRPYSGKEVHNMAKKINVVLGMGPGSSSKLTPKEQVFKKKSMFWQLPYDRGEGVPMFDEMVAIVFCGSRP
jgi:hypothetical protein